MRFCTIGTGKIVDLFLSAASTVSGFELAAVYSRDKEKAKSFAEKHAAESFLSDLDELAQRSDIDAVYIASPNSLHFEQAMLMLSHKKHVLCEKPAATNRTQLKKMLGCAKENGVIFLEASRHLHAPSFELIKKLLPRLGKLRRVSLVYNQYSSRYDNFKRGIVENAFNPAFSNGAIMDIGIYCIELCAALFGEPLRIFSDCIKLTDSIDGQGFILAAYEEHLVEMSYSKICSEPLGSEFVGEEGALLLDSLNDPKKLTLIPRFGEKEEFFCSKGENNLIYEIEDFIGYASGKAGAQFFADVSLTALSIADKARKTTNIVFPDDEISLK